MTINVPEVTTLRLSENVMKKSTSTDIIRTRDKASNFSGLLEQFTSTRGNGRSDKSPLSQSDHSARSSSLNDNVNMRRQSKVNDIRNADLDIDKADNDSSGSINSYAAASLDIAQLMFVLTRFSEGGEVLRNSLDELDIELNFSELMQGFKFLHENNSHTEQVQIIFGEEGWESKAVDINIPPMLLEASENPEETPISLILGSLASIKSVDDYEEFKSYIIQKLIQKLEENNLHNSKSNLEEADISNQLFSEERLLMSLSEIGDSSSFRTIKTGGSESDNLEKRLSSEKDKEGIDKQELLNSKVNDAPQKSDNSKDSEDFFKNYLSDLSVKDNAKKSKEEKILDELISKGDKENFSKVNLLVSHLNSTANSMEAEAVNTAAANRYTFAADIIKAVKYMEESSIKELYVKITPKELGEVVIRITVEAGIMKANIAASNKEAYQLLNSHLQEIKTGLEGDIKIQNVSINIYQGDTTFFKDGSKQQEERKNQKSNGEIRLLSLEDEVLDADTEIKDDSSINILA
jgi:flagellar hook-length control protein FliK